MAASARGARAPLAAGKGFSRETSVRNARRAVVPARRAVGGTRKTASVGSDANSVTRGVRARADGRDGLEARGTSSVAASADETTGVKARESVVARASGDAGDAVASPEGPSLDSILRSKSGFTKILCANRGEIAVRVFRAGTELGMKTVAIFAEADRQSTHRYKADESYEVGRGKAPVAAYLDYESIIRVAKENGAQAIHPGYGLLSENSDFARRCEEEGIVLIGPRSQTLIEMGDKVIAKAKAKECGLPLVPGTEEATDSVEDALAFAKEFGMPIMLKAAMGGGGRGMRVVREFNDLEDAFKRASSEATTAFGDGRMFLERYVEAPRHIEVQILGDNYGNIVHLGERDCSVQRRHQKVVELAPAPNLDPVLRQRLFDDAVKLAKHVNYRNAGTVEFMVDAQGRHYFLEVNPRIQVEHTVTEEVTGIDLVQSQILIAGGQKLSDIGIKSQDDVQLRGFAMQCRITTEDPSMNFAPDFGKVEVYRPPGGMGVRLDGEVVVGSRVSPNYDSLLVKLTCSEKNFESTVQKMYRSLNEFRIRGVKTNIPFLLNVLNSPTFLSANFATDFIDSTPSLFKLDSYIDDTQKLLNYLGDVAVNGSSHPGAVGPAPTCDEPPVPEPKKSIEQLEGTGFKAILDKEGPAAFAKAVRDHKGLLIMDTTWRDAHQSLLATRVRTHDLRRSAPLTRSALDGAYSLEMWGGATFDVALRFLQEDPWRRLELLREQVPNIPFQMLLRGANAVGYTSYADNVVQDFVHQARKSGVDVFRIFDSLNYTDNLLFGIDAVRAANGVVEATICYSGDVSDPKKTKYTLDYYVDLTTKLVEHGIDVLAVKDMAGLLKPRAATMLISAIRQKFPDLPIHVHTHDTASTGVASMLAAAAAGADVVDVCMDAMAGTTSQPAIGAVVNSVAGTELDTGMDIEEILKLNLFWEQTRGLYSPYESGIKSGSSDVYIHEMPGGQYTNLKFQAYANGLGSEWDRIKDSYATANKILGDIVKVTPSSKVVGDFAQFLVANNLDEHSVVEKADTLSFPTSVVEYFQGYLGQPVGGFPEPLRSKVVKNKDVINGRPGASIPSLDLKKLQSELSSKHAGRRSITHKDTLAAALYPKVFDEYVVKRDTVGPVGLLPTKAFLSGLDIDEEIEVTTDRGVSTNIKLKAVGELLPSGNREVFFEVNAIPRVVEIHDRKILESSSKASTTVTREKSDPLDPGSVGAPMSGNVVEVLVAPGQKIKAGEPLVVLSAMKMETTVSSPVSGTLKHCAVIAGDTCSAGDLMVAIDIDA
jgi:pyruvate carboxylase